LKNRRFFPLPIALGWIVASMLVCAGGGHALFRRMICLRGERLGPAVEAIVQTGPQKEALKTAYLAELLGLSADRPCPMERFDVEKARARLLRSPLISRAEVKRIPPNTVYVDYTVRQPIAWVANYRNAALDKEGVVFPFAPFFAPKNLPGLYLGALAHPVRWGCTLRGKELDLALDVLRAVTDLSVCDQLHVVRIDVSQAFAKSYGRRELVLTIEDRMTLRREGKDVPCVIPRLLRLSPKHYAQGLGNYLKLREQLFEEENKQLLSGALAQSETDVLHIKAQVLDFRLSQLAFVKN